MSKYAGTQTEKNLQAAFAGESQARNKYTYFASVAKKEGYEQISSRNYREQLDTWLRTWLREAEEEKGEHGGG